MTDVKAANLEYFKKLAEEYDTDSSRVATRAIATKVLQYHSPSETGKSTDNEDFTTEQVGSSGDLDIEGINKNVWDEDRTRVLDFACGTGLVSEALAPYAKQIIGVDISPDMVRVYNEKMYNHGIPKEEMQAIVADIMEPGQAPVPEFQNFDAAVASMCYHHLEDTARATKALASRLRSGGRLYVIDLERQQGESDQWFDNWSDEKKRSAGVVHLGGINRSAMKKEFEDAGLKDVDNSKSFRVRLWLTEDEIKGKHAHGHGHGHDHGGSHGHGGDAKGESHKHNHAHGHAHDHAHGPFGNLDITKLATKEGKNGETLYGTKMYLMLVVGTKP